MLVSEHARADEEDHRLMVRARLGDMAAFGQLYERHHRGVLRLLLVALEGFHTAEDATHDVFVRVESKLASYDPLLGTFQRWLYGLAGNVASEELRRQSRLAFCTPSELLEHHDAYRHADDPGTARVHINWIRRELVPLVRHRLSADQAEAFVLVKILDYSPQEVALMMGTTYGNVRVLTARAIAKLNGIPVPINRTAKRQRRMAMWIVLRPVPVVSNRRFALWASDVRSLYGRGA